MTFNAHQWAEEHEQMDTIRFGHIGRQLDGIYKVLGVAGTILLAILGWSLKTQYDSMDTQVRTAQVQLQAIRELKAEVSKSAN